MLKIVKKMKAKANIEVTLLKLQMLEEELLHMKAVSKSDLHLWKIYMESFAKEVNLLNIHAVELLHFEKLYIFAKKMVAHKEMIHSYKQEEVRIIGVGPIHGNFKYLDSIGNENVGHLEDDVIVLLGDFIDPDNAQESIQQAMELAFEKNYIFCKGLSEEVWLLGQDDKTMEYAFINQLPTSVETADMFMMNSGLDDYRDALIECDFMNENPTEESLKARKTKRPSKKLIITNEMMNKEAVVFSQEHLYVGINDQSMIVLSLKDE